MAMNIEGERSQRFRIYRCDSYDAPCGEAVAAYDTLAEVWAHGYRLDWRYKIYAGGKYLTPYEFTKWAQAQGEQAQPSAVI